MMALRSVSRVPYPPSAYWTLWPLWVLASVGGSVLSVAVMIVGIAVARAVFGLFDEDGLLGPMLLPAFGACVGLAQWLVLRSSLARAYWWPIATTAGCVAAYYLFSLAGPGLSGLADADPRLRALVPIGMLGVTIGLCQWVYLRRVAKRAGWWILISAFSWSPLALLALGSAASLEQVAPWLGLVPSITAGGALVLLLRRPT